MMATEHTGRDALEALIASVDINYPNSDWGAEMFCGLVTDHRHKACATCAKMGTTQPWVKHINGKARRGYLCSSCDAFNTRESLRGASGPGVSESRSQKTGLTAPEKSLHDPKRLRWLQANVSKESLSWFFLSQTSIYRGDKLKFEAELGFIAIWSVFNLGYVSKDNALDYERPMTAITEVLKGILPNDKPKCDSEIARMVGMPRQSYIDKYGTVKGKVYKQIMIWEEEILDSLTV